MSTENRSQAKRAVLISCSDHYGHRLWAVDTYLKSRGYETVYLTSDFSHDRKAAFTCSVPGCRQLHVRPYQKNLPADRILSHREFAKKAVRGLEELEQEPESEVLIETLVQTDERSRMLHLCMEELHPAYREALYLVYFEGMRHAEAAAVMRKTEKQIADLVYRGKASLRKALEKEGITAWYI